MIALAVLSWATLAVLLGAFLRMVLRSDAGFGAAGRGRHESRPERGSPPAIPPRSVSSYDALRP